MKKIVVIEDDVILRENTLVFLREEGFDARAAADGLAGLLLAKEVIPDLVLCDIGLPKMNGYETCIAIKKVEKLKDVPVIFLTAYGDSQSILTGFEAGAQDYITKPYNYKELLARVNTHLELKQKKEQLSQMNLLLEEKVKERTSELENANKQLETANAELLKLDKVKSDFLNMISQEIRNPLNRIKEPIELLKYKIENKNLAELIEIIDESVARLEKFASQAMEITQLRTNRYVLNNAENSIAGIADYAVLSVQKHLVEKKINLSMKIPEGLKIFGDSDLMVKCIANILVNACKYSHPEGTVEISANEQPGKLIIEIKDYGTGMDSEILANISQMLIPGEIRLEQNIGVGLFHSKLIAEAHGGVIHIKSIEGEGTTVTIIFPTTNDQRMTM